VSLEGAIQFYPKLERQHAEARGKLFMPSYDRDALQQTDLDSKIVRPHCSNRKCHMHAQFLLAFLPHRYLDDSSDHYVLVWLIEDDLSVSVSIWTNLGFS